MSFQFVCEKNKNVEVEIVITCFFCVGNDVRMHDDVVFTDVFEAELYTFSIFNFLKAINEGRNPCLTHSSLISSPIFIILTPSESYKTKKKKQGKMLRLNT